MIRRPFKPFTNLALAFFVIAMVGWISGCSTTEVYDGPPKTLTVATSENFESLVLNSDKPVLLDFWAPWCGPCKQLMPTMESLAGKYDGKILIAKVNIDDEPELAEKYRVSSIPRLIFFRDGKVVIDEGGRTRTELEREIAAVLK